MSLKEGLFLTAGLLFTGFGIVGIFLPVIPTTAPLLAAAWFFSKSSRKFHTLLVNHPVLGRYIASFLTYGAISFRGKIMSISMMWLMIIISGVFLISSTVLRFVLAAAGAAGTVRVLAYPSLKSGDVPAESPARESES